jgi:hypothetical protein
MVVIFVAHPSVVQSELDGQHMPLLQYSSTRGVQVETGGSKVKVVPSCADKLVLSVSWEFRGYESEASIPLHLNSSKFACASSQPGGWVLRTKDLIEQGRSTRCFYYLIMWYHLCYALLTE